MRAPLSLLCLSLLVVGCAAADGITRLTGGRPSRVDWSGGQKITGPLPHEYLAIAALPTTFDWRDVSGQSWLTLSKNQHIPQYTTQTAHTPCAHRLSTA